MASRALDWFRQAKRDITFAQDSKNTKRYEWVCFIAHQAAEKSLKAVLHSLGVEAWGHSIVGLLEECESRNQQVSQLKAKARALDKLYIPTRYPNGFASGAPFEYFDNDDATAAIESAELFFLFAKEVLVREGVLKVD